PASVKYAASRRGSHWRRCSRFSRTSRSTSPALSVCQGTSSTPGVGTGALLRPHVEQTEGGALRVGEDAEPSAGKVLRRHHLAGTPGDGLLLGRVNVGDGEVHHPVARHLGGNHGVHLHGAGD